MDLQDPDEQDVLPGGVLHVDGDEDADEDADGRVDAEHDHVHDDLDLLDPAGDHVGAHTEHDRHRVDGDRHQQLPHPRVRLLQPDGHPLQAANQR